MVYLEEDCLSVSCCVNLELLVGFLSAVMMEDCVGVSIAYIETMVFLFRRLNMKFFKRCPWLWASS